jgi:hypothetical protein
MVGLNFNGHKEHIGMFMKTALTSGPASAQFCPDRAIQTDRVGADFTGSSGEAERWPAQPLEQWRDTYATLHMWTQIVGKIRLALTPLINHWWNVPLYVNGRGLTTSLIPYRDRPFELWFDLPDQQLVFETSDGLRKSLSLKSVSVADFYPEVMQMLRSSGIEVNIWRMPVEIPDAIPFDEDNVHAACDPEAAQRFWRILLSVHCAFEELRSRSSANAALSISSGAALI